MSDEAKDSGLVDTIERALNSAARAENVLARLHDNDPVTVPAIWEAQQDLLRDLNAMSAVIDDLRKRKPEDLSITCEGAQLIRVWRSAAREVQSTAKKMLNAEQEYERSTQALGKWLTPTDARVEEKFAVWFGDSLIESVLREDGTYDVRVRSFGKTLRDL